MQASIAHNKKAVGDPLLMNNQWIVDVDAQLLGKVKMPD